MKIPSIVYKARDAIEGLVPRDSAVSAVTHLGFGAAGATAGTFALGARYPTAADAAEGEFTREKFHRMMAGAGNLALPVLLLTAGMQLRSPGGTLVPNGVNPFYFLAAGALIGQHYIVNPITETWKR